MRNRIFWLAVLAAATIAVPAPSSSAQELTLPAQLASGPAYEVSDGLLAGRTELALTNSQAADLVALSAELHSQEKFLQASAKPWTAAARRPSARQTFDRALAILTPAQRRPAALLLAAADEAAR
jgi:hypothetical protein